MLLMTIDSDPRDEPSGRTLLSENRLRNASTTCKTVMDCMSLWRALVYELYNNNCRCRNERRPEFTLPDLW